MNDKELLELAAKAAGIDAEWIDGDYSADGLWLKGSRGPDNSSFWNPLSNDGDALRLAVKLRIKFEVHSTHPYAAAFAPGIVGRFEETTVGDEMSATRRAIVRAAACC